MRSFPSTVLLCCFLCLILMSLGSRQSAQAGANPHYLTNGPTFFDDGSEQLVWYGVDSRGYPTGKYVLWNLDSKGKRLTSTPAFGPRAGWFLLNNGDPVTLSDGSYFLIWASSDESSVVLWKMDSTHHFLSASQTLAADYNWWFDRLYQAPDGSLHVIWQHLDSSISQYDQYVFWKLDGTGNFVSSSNLLAVGTGWVNNGPQENADGTWYILWRGITSSHILNNQFVFWNLDASGSFVSSSNLLAAGTGWTTDQPQPRTASGFTPWYIFWTAVDANGQQTGKYVVWNLDKNGNLVSTSPPLAAGAGWISDGPIQKHIVSSASNAWYILWKSVDSSGKLTGMYVFWNLDSKGNLVNSSNRLAASSGWITQGPEQDSRDGTWHIVWYGIDSSSNLTSTYVIWQLDANGSFTYSTPAFGPDPGWGLVDNYYDGASVPLSDGSSFLIWGKSNGSQVVLWKLDSAHHLVSSSQILSAATGWSFDQMYQAPDGSLHIMWVCDSSGSTNEQYIFWTVDATGNFVSSSKMLDIGANWTTSHGGDFVSGPYLKADGTWQLFWTGLAPGTAISFTGQYAFWELDAAGNMTSSATYGPY